MQRTPFAPHLMAALPALVLSLCVLSCGDPPPPPCELRCNGCCNAEGLCLPTGSQSEQACGIGGSTCGTCAAGQTCATGRCVGEPTDGGTDPDGGLTCGRENGQCCTGGSPACTQGLSCVGGTCQAALCGAEGMACCLTTCNDGLACVSGTCRASTPPDAGPACGGRDEACCDGIGCEGGLECRGTTCQPPVADGGTDAGTNLPVGSACSANAQCADGRCRTANFEGGYCTRSCDDQAQCPGGTVCATDPFNSVAGKMCLDACSALGTQADCRSGYVCERTEHRMGDPGVCVPRCVTGSGACPGGLACNATSGQCCGANGFACCAGTTCDSLTTCGADGFCHLKESYGSECTSGVQCPGGTCITSQNADWPGGYCSGNCEAGVERCAEDNGACSPAFGNATGGAELCLDVCTFDGGQSSCRNGYVCDLGWSDTAGQASCVPSCPSDDFCGGLGRCVSGFCCGEKGLSCCKSGTSCTSGTCQGGICR